MQILLEMCKVFTIDSLLFWLHNSQMCFFGAVGYAVLLRDMLQPITDAITNHTHHHNATLGSWSINEWGLEAEEGGGPSVASNLTMLGVILIITPVCTLKNLSSLDKLGAASMSSILILGACIVFRSLQCNIGHPDESFDGHNWRAFKLWPDSAKDVLGKCNSPTCVLVPYVEVLSANTNVLFCTTDAFPLFVSCYVCHYNIPAVHNELQNPSKQRVNYWTTSTTVAASLFYMTVGLAGSAYGHCTPTGKVQGNVLLDFDEDDPLLLVARMCLACTITLAFPLLVIPARDILLRSWFAPSTTSTTVIDVEQETSNDNNPERTTDSSLREPLLTNDSNHGGEGGDGEEVDADTTRAGLTASTEAQAVQPQQHSFGLRLGAAILVLWSASAVASCVKSIDIVWDLLGSSLSILLSYLIPCASFIVIVGSTENDADFDANEDSGDLESGNRSKRNTAILIAKGMILIYTVLMVISTANAVIATFFAH